MTTISGLPSTSPLLVNIATAPPKPSTSSSATTQSADSSAGSSTAAQSASNASSTTPSPTNVAAAAGAVANSASYSFATVAQNALTTINANIQATGITPSLYTTGTQWGQVFGDMDRRSLYAVASNEGGQFSKLEQQTASSMMTTQLTTFNSSSPESDSERLAGIGNYINFLQNVSPEEKASPLWAVDMASGKTAYNDYASDLGQPQQTAAGTNSLVEVLMAAMKSAKSDPSKDMTVGQENTLDGIKSQPWAQGYESQIDTAYQAVLLQTKGLNILA